MQQIVTKNDQTNTMQRSFGVGRLSVNSDGKRSNISKLYQQGCAKIRFPNPFLDVCEAVMINTSGGITGGDQMSWNFVAEENSDLTITTQACERLYSSTGQTASIDISLKAEEHSKLHWLPQETILFDGSQTSRTIEVDLAENSELLLVESMIFGRQAMQEHLKTGVFSDRWRIRENDNLIHAEAINFSGDLKAKIQKTAISKNKKAFASLLYIAKDAEQQIEKAREIIGEFGGVSYWNIGETGKLFARLYAEDSYSQRKRLTKLIELLKKEAQMPKCWII